jgi:hypothetical protein
MIGADTRGVAALNIEAEPVLKPGIFDHHDLDHMSAK